MQVTGSKYVSNKYFDTESGTPIGVDNRCSGCISNIMDDFIGPLVECNQPIKGFGGTRPGIVKTRTRRWRWLYNNGKRHKFPISNSYYVPQGGEQIMRPQNWEQAQKYENTIQGTGRTIDTRAVSLYWDHIKYELTIPLYKSNNVYNINTASVYITFKMYCQKAELGPNMDSYPLVVEQATSEVSEYESEVDGHGEPEVAFKKSGSPTQLRLNGLKETTPSSKSMILVDDEDRGEPNLTTEILKFLDIFGHCSFCKIQIMADSPRDGQTVRSQSAHHAFMQR